MAAQLQLASGYVFSPVGAFRHSLSMHNENDAHYWYAAVTAIGVNELSPPKREAAQNLCLCLIETVGDPRETEWSESGGTVIVKRPLTEAEQARMA